MSENAEPDWRRAASQLLRALRGDRSQGAFCRRLGYRSNVACEWEAGRRLPTAAETLRACIRFGVDVDEAARSFSRPSYHALRSPSGELSVDAWLRALVGTLTINEVAAHSGYSRYAVSRWLRGQAQPRLDAFLRLIEALTGRASDLVARLVPIEAVTELYALHQARVARRRLAYDAPWTEAVMRVLETRGYRSHPQHPPGYIARRLGLTPEQERAVLDLLEEAGVVRFEDDKFQDIVPLTVDTAQAAPEDIAGLKAHWTRVCLERVAAPRDKDWLGYNVMSIAEADLERIRNVLRNAYAEVRAIASASEAMESVALLNMQLVTWDES